MSTSSSSLHHREHRRRRNNFLDVGHQSTTSKELAKEIAYKYKIENFFVLSRRGWWCRPKRRHQQPLSVLAASASQVFFRCFHASSLVAKGFSFFLCSVLMLTRESLLTMQQDNVHQLLWMSG